jgi:hypothetical protein
MNENADTTTHRLVALAHIAHIPDLRRQHGRRQDHLLYPSLQGGSQALAQ